MSGARESGLWKWLRKAQFHYRGALAMYRVENMLAAGMADVEGSLLDSQFFAELKSEARPARENTPIRFKVKDREAQMNWLKERWRLAGNAWLFVQVGSSHQAARYLIPGQYAQSVYDGLCEADIAILSRSSATDTAADIVARMARRKHDR